MSRRALVLLGAVVFFLAVTGCHPVQSGPIQCPVANYNVTVLKDEQFVGNNPAVDAIMETLRSTTGAPGCVVGIMENNEISYLKAYGFRDMRPPAHLRDHESGEGYPARARPRLREGRS